MLYKDFSCVAVANRGEAAVRFMRAARSWSRERGIALSTVALYTHADADAPFVRMASASVCLGDAMVRGDDGKLRSAYLDVDRIVALAKQAGADALWPGWGFASERPELQEACAAQGLVFLGPPASAMRALGDKIAAKRLAESAGVPVSPWSRESVDEAGAAACAARIGYPVLLKATAGGGGRGIRRVDHPDELVAAYQSAAAEAGAAFGDPSIFVEAFVADARHVEVQVLADSHGGVWALGTRDCSMQRRQQKVLEEAPAPGLSAQTEAALCAAGANLARTSGYVSAGTAEFLLLPDLKTFYFLEMNTRLQVEHTVTEEIFGLDLVGLQIDVGRGAHLPAAQPPAPRGAAIEARLNAEDPDQGFAPRAGRLLQFDAPLGPGVRFDSGYVQGNVVPTVFDSMLAKVIAHGATRQAALARLESALRETVIVLDSGLTNRSLLLELVSGSVFRDGPVTTRWLDRHVAARPGSDGRSHLEPALAAAALGDYLRLRRGHIANFIEQAQRVVPHTVPEPGPVKIRFMLGTQPLEVEVGAIGPQDLRMRCGDWQAVVRAQPTGAGTLLLDLGGRRFAVQHAATSSEVHVEVEGIAHRFRRVSDGRVRAELPASVAQVHVQPGDRVQVGMRILTLEAMKMETIIDAPMAGTVRAVHVRPSSQVAAGEVMVEIDEGADSPPAAGTGIRLAAGHAAGLDALCLVEARLLGFDVTADELAGALAALEADPAPPRDRLLKMLRAAVVQEQLFKSGAFDDALNDAGESSMDQLAWFAHHRRFDDKKLCARYTRRLGRFLALHGIERLADGDPAVAPALLRLFQARRLLEDASALVLAVLRALGRSRPAAHAASPPALEQRVVFEKLASEAVQRGDLKVATAAWNLIHDWQDLPAWQADIAQAATEADQRWRDLAAAATPASRTAAAHALQALPLGAVVGTLAGRSDSPTVIRDPDLVLGQLLARIYEVGEITAAAALQGRHACQHLRSAAGAQVVGVLLTAPCDLLQTLALLPADAEADLLLAFVPAADAFDGAARLQRQRWTALWVESGEMRARTWVHAGDSMVEQTVLRDVHPARPVAQEVARFANFQLQRLPAPAGLLLLRAVAQGEDRLIALAEVERFDPEIDGDFVRVPGFEHIYLSAVQALREGMRTASGRTPAFNRISLFVRPTVTLARPALDALARRLGPATFDLALHKVAMHGRFTLGDSQPPRDLAAEWRDATALGPRLEVVLPRQRLVPVMSAYEQQVLAARRRRLFHPYEVISWLTSREDIGRIERGQFDELELDATGRALVSVRGRPAAGNPTGVVVGLITNWSERFPDGLRRVLLLGDPNKDMGSLGEGECRRIIAAIDHAQALGVPVEWVALSGGARIAFDSGTENLDWTAAVLRRIVEFTARGGVVNILVDGPCVGAQSYWNAEATMLMHCRGTLVMTPRGYMVLTGKRALEVSGSVAAETNEGIGGLEIMAANGQAQYTAPDLKSAYEMLLRHYDYTHVAPGEQRARQRPSTDPVARDVTSGAYTGAGGFATIGDLFSESGNPGRKKPFAIREVMTAVLDQDAPPLERWKALAGGETTVVMHGQLGGHPICLIGIESQPLPRRGPRPVDGPASWMSGTLFPHSSRKMARAIRSASGQSPVVVLANLSGFDGSPESMRERQLEFGAEIGKAVVEFDGPILFCVVARYHGGAYVVFSRRLSGRLDAVALEGSYASVIGGGAAAAVVFTRLVRDRSQADPRVVAARQVLAEARLADRRQVQEDYERVLADVAAQVQTDVAREFDAVHNVARALDVGSLDAVMSAKDLRPSLCARLAQALAEGAVGSTSKP
ncbi:MAG: carboxyl transferase domain-containing protein [Aquabacterium sp.]|nr:carboxyl transferase domain-containing protein [Aquabacterium sp.]